MATPISRDILNKETNARFWAQTGFKPGQRLDPNNQLDKAMMPVWMDIFRKVTAEADEGTLVTTYDRPEVAQPLADAEIASAVAALHVDTGAKDPNPTTVQQHTSAAATAMQIVAQKLIEAASNQPPTVSPSLTENAAKEAARTPPSPYAPAADQIAHAQTHNGQNGQNGQILRPEDDPWNPRYVPKSPSPREQPSAQPSKSPRERPSREVLYKEVNARFWRRYNYKPGQKLDMAIAEDRKMAKLWTNIFHEVEREANEGRLTFTRLELVPAPDAARPPRPSPRPLRPTPPRPLPPRPTPPSMQQPMPPPPSQRPMPPIQPPPGMQRPMPPGMPPGMQPWPPPGMQQPMPPPDMQQPMPPGMPPGMQPWPPPDMQQPMPRPDMQQPMPRPDMQQPMSPGRQPPGMQPWPPPGMQQPTPSAPTEGGPPSPMEWAPTPAPTEEASPAITTEAAPVEGMSIKAKIALAVLSLGGLGALAYAVTSKPARPAFRPRARASARVSPAFASSSAFPSLRGGRS